MYYVLVVFRYLKEFFVKFWEYIIFMYMEDKYYCKVGVLDYFVVVVDCGKRVIVG